ncbi:hypothetical protein [Paenirhodobacter ferrireducens]|uniref:hypothetical protein n=1 Tax=Paenirhodobacter ferrireducens TaxID=1215032 RepID=UPI0013E2F5A7|nr:hypothetical protein [Sinirhodobacter ferrireducens]
MTLGTGALGPYWPVEHALMPRCSFPEAVGRGIVQQNPGRMSLMRTLLPFRDIAELDIG